MKKLKKYNKYRRIKTKKINKKKKTKEFDGINYYINYFLIIIKFIIIFLVFMHIIHFYKSNSLDLKIISQKIIDYENNLKKYTDAEIKEFRKINSDNHIIDNLHFTKKKHPIISVIVTFHNQAHCIHKCIKSIQNQSIKNLEIILVDDCSTDNSTEIISEFQKYDERIILIKHDKSGGPLKSRCDGIRSAQGTFITIIDGDDALIHKDVLNNSLSIAKLGNLDVVEFKASYYKNGEFKTVVNNYDIINITGIVYQPELRTKFFVINDNDSIRAIQNRNIWAKLIRNEIFQKAIINIGPKYTEHFVMRYEDTIMSVALLQVAKSYYLMKEVGYYYSRDEFRGRFPSLKNKTC